MQQAAAIRNIHPRRKRGQINRGEAGAAIQQVDAIRNLHPRCQRSQVHGGEAGAAIQQVVAIRNIHPRRKRGQVNRGEAGAAIQQAAAIRNIHPRRKRGQVNRGEAGAFIQQGGSISSIRIILKHILAKVNQLGASSKSNIINLTPTNAPIRHQTRGRGHAGSDIPAVPYLHLIQPVIPIGVWIRLGSSTRGVFRHAVTPVYYVIRRRGVDAYRAGGPR